MARREWTKPLPEKLVRSLARLASTLSRDYGTRLQNDLVRALKLYHWLQANPVGTKTLLRWAGPFYRVTHGGFDPLSVAGSLADGGRFNVGGAQQLPPKVMRGVRKAPCLYGASSRDGALAEAAEPIGAHQMFELKPKRASELWDLRAVLAAVEYPGLAARIDATPMAQRWALQKSPLESQVLAHHLRGIGGQGIVYESQKLSGAKTVAFFLVDELDSHRSFSAKAI